MSDLIIPTDQIKVLAEGDYIFPAAPQNLTQVPHYLVDLCRAVKTPEYMEYEVIQINEGESRFSEGLIYAASIRITTSINDYCHVLMFNFHYRIIEGELGFRVWLTHADPSLEGRYIYDPDEMNRLAQLSLRGATFLRTAPRVLDDCMPLAKLRWEEAQIAQKRTESGIKYITTQIAQEYGLVSVSNLEKMIANYMTGGWRAGLLSDSLIGLEISRAGLIKHMLNSTYVITPLMIERIGFYKDQWMREGEPSV